MSNEPPMTSDVTSATPLARVTRARRGGRALLEWVVILLVAIGVSFVVRAYAFQTFFIPSGSMEPTLLVGDRIVVDKLSVDFGAIHRGDILVFKAPPTENCGGPPVTDLVKRVIGLPGDVLTSKGNTIYVNGKPLTENWPHTEPLGPAIGRVVVPANHYFMMGDHHDDSCDSRSWGPITRSEIIGKAFLRIWPLNRVGSL
ncbi:MAG: signal peptidase I [Acidobacteriota bacterium]|nr:signal peptidase I [Acidobacteriota bacterium]